MSGPVPDPRGGPEGELSAAERADSLGWAYGIAAALLRGDDVDSDEVRRLVAGPQTGTPAHGDAPAGGEELTRVLSAAVAATSLELAAGAGDAGADVAAALARDLAAEGTGEDAAARAAAALVAGRREACEREMVELTAQRGAVRAAWASARVLARVVAWRRRDEVRVDPTPRGDGDAAELAQRRCWQIAAGGVDGLRDVSA